MKKLMALLAAGAAFAASADVIYFTSGDRLTGTMKTIAGGKITFASDVAGDLTIDVKKVSKMEVSKESEVLYNDETRQSLRLGLENGVYSEVDAAGKPLRKIDMAAVKQVNPEAEKWHGSVNIGGNIQRGNTVSESVAIEGAVNRRWEKDRFTANGGYYFTQSGSSKQNKQKTENRAELAAQEDHFWSKRVYSYVNGKYETDRINDLEHRYRLGAGVGYQWLEGQVFESTGKWSFSQEAGLEYVKERYNNTDHGADDNYAAFRYAHHLAWIPGFVKNVEAFHNLEYHPDTGDWADEYILDADAGIATKVFDGWTLTLKAEWDYDSAPAQHAKKSDLRYIVALGYKW